MRDILESLACRCTRDPDREALVHVHASGGHEARSVGWLVNRTLAYREAFADPAWSASPVLVFAPRSPECVAMLLGAALAGRAFASLNIKLKPDQVQAIASRAGVSRIVTDRAGARLFQRRQGEGPKVTLWRGDEAVPADAASTADAPGELGRLAANLDGSTSACCLFTSGSTGEPKGVLITGDDLCRRAAVEVDCYGLTADDRVLNVLPFSFDVGLNQLLTSLLSGAVLLIMDSWLPRDLLDVVATHGVSGISGVPAVWRDLRASGLPVDLQDKHRSLRYITVSGGSLTVPELAALSALVPGVGIFKTYGQTETFRSTMLQPSDFGRRLGSVGRACPGVRLRIVADDGRDCVPGEVGELVHSGIGVMAGYLDGSDLGTKRRDNPFAGGEGESAFAIWTGDLGYLDEEQFLFLKGRRDGMLKVAGNRFYPDEVASVAAQFEGVTDVEVLGLDPDAVETRVALFVVAPAAGWSSHRLVDVLRQRLPTYMVPTVVRVLPALPRLANGKPDRVRLRELAAGSPGAEE